MGPLDLSRRVRIGLLGPLEVSLDGEPVVVAGTKRRALLTRLAVRSGEVVPAERLLHDIWAGKPPSAGLTTLQSHIAHLRRALGVAGPMVATASPGYVLRLDATSIDATTFARVVESARGNLDPQDRAREIDGGLQLWRGRPLVEFEGDGWADPIARELDELRIEAEDLRADAQLRLGHHAALVPRLEALAEAHPYRERLWLHLMAALQGCGRHVEALRAGQQLRAVLGEIGVSPSPELNGLEARILRHVPNEGDEPPRSASVAQPVPSAPLQQPDRFTLVGRDREVLALRSAVERFGRDGQRAVLVAGEAGVGKSRLVRCAAALAREWGGLVIEGRCDDALAIPFQPFVEALCAFLASPGRANGDSSWSARLGEQPEELARMVPEIRSVLPDLRPAPAVGPDLAEHRFSRAVDSWLSAVTTDQPVLLVVEDLHWATRPTLVLLRHILRSSPERPLLVVASYRDTEPWRAAGWSSWLSELRRRPDTVAMDLDGLDPDAVARLIDQARAEPHHPDPRPGTAARSAGTADPLAAEVHRITRGNALLVIELLRHLGAADQLGRLTTAGGTRAGSLERLGVPAGVRLLVRDRLERLDDDVADTLERAAVLGTEVDARVLRASSPADDRRLVEALDQLVGAQFLEPGDSGTYAYRFPHGLVREAVLHGISDLRRAMLHRDAGNAVEAVHAGHLDRFMDVLAAHFREAAPVAGASQAIAYGTMAGHRALHEGAAEDSLAHFTATLALMDAEQVNDDTARCEALLGLGEAQRRVEVGRHRETFLLAAATARRLGDRDRQARAAKGISRGFHAIVGEPDRERTDLISSALCSQGEEPSEQRALLLASLAGEELFGQRVERSRKLVAEAVAVAREVGSDALLVRTLATQFDVLFHPETLDVRGAIASELHGLARRCTDSQLHLRAALTAFTCGLERGDRAAVEQAVAEVERLGHGRLAPASMRFVPTVRATWALARGDLREAEASATRAHELGAGHSEADAEVVFLAHMFQIRSLQGRLAELDDVLRQTTGLMPAADAAYAYLCQAVGRHDEAIAVVDRLVGDGTRPLPRDAAWPFAIGLLAETVARLGGPGRAGDLAALLLPALAQNLAHFSYFLGPTTYFVGILRETQGELAEAEVCLVQAERSARALGAARSATRARQRRTALSGR